MGEKKSDKKLNKIARSDRTKKILARKWERKSNKKSDKKIGQKSNKKSGKKSG